MRFTTILFAGAFAAIASAQSKTDSLSPAQKSQKDCLDACEDGDVKCQSYCITVPSPNDSQVNATNECVAGCSQGKGTEADTKRYSTCVNNCVANNYWKSVDGTPRQTNAPSNDKSKDDKSDSNDSATQTSGSDDTASAAATDSATGTGEEATADATGTNTGSEETGSSTGSSSSSSPTESGNAAPMVVGGMSLLSLFVAVLAL